LTALRVQAYYNGFGSLQMSLVEGNETRHFGADGIASVSGNIVVEGTAANGELLAQGNYGSATGVYRTSSGSVTYSGVSSSGTVKYWRNRTLVNQVSTPVYVNGTDSYTRTSSSLTIYRSDLYAEYARQ
jgi:hypothetical protein